MERASLANSTDVPRFDTRHEILLNAQTVRSYYYVDLAVPLAPARPSAILLASGRTPKHPVPTATRRSGMDSGYSEWIGLPVVLQVALGDIKVPLPGKLLKEAGDTVRIRIGDRWDVDIYKAMILPAQVDALGALPAWPAND